MSDARRKNLGSAPSLGRGGAGLGRPVRSSGSHTYHDAMFPSAPYATVSEMFMSPSVQTKVQAPSTQTGRNTTVASAKFAHFTTIVPVEPKPSESTLFTQTRYVSVAYRTMNRYNGKHVFLRRIIDTNITEDTCQAVSNACRSFRHPNLVPLHSITATHEFVLGSKDAIVEYRLIRGGRPFIDCFISKEVETTEGLLWSIACQLVSLLHHFHDVGVPLRGLRMSKLIYLDASARVYFSGLGLVDLIDGPATPPMVAECMRYDITSLGAVLAQLATRSTVLQDRATVHESILRTGRFSSTFASFVKNCLDGDVRVGDLCGMLSERMCVEVANQQGTADFLLTECSKEANNGRLMRLMIKLNLVLTSTTDMTDCYQDRYLLKLFQHYTFNQVDEANRPRLDWGHVFHTLNKLDTGSDELVQLIGSDGQSIMIVSYHDVRETLDSAFEQLQLQSLVDTPSNMAALLSSMTPPSHPNV